MQRKRTVLLVEDEASIIEPLAESLGREGFDTKVAGTVVRSAPARSEIEPDLVLLDVMLPDGSGFDVCRELRQNSQVPIIMLTARGEEADRIVGLELGADDYIVKPFSAAKSRRGSGQCCAAQTRRSRPDEKPIDVGELRLDPAKREVTKDGEVLELSRKEFELLKLLMRTRLGGQPRKGDRRGLGYEVVRVDEDARRPHQRPPPEAGRRFERAAVPAHDSRGRVPVRHGRRAVSLRLRILLAFAYGFLLILVALEVPLALNLSRRVDAEVRNDAAGQAHIVAAQASGSMNRPVRAPGSTERAASALGARVIVVDSTGALRADSAGRRGPRRTRAGRRSGSRSPAAPRRANGTARRSARTSCTPPCP